MEIKVLYGTETGNSEKLANDAKKYLDSNGFSAQVVDMGNVKIGDLASYEAALLITSTWGDGEPPANAENLYNELQNSSADLSNLKYGVFAIGESFYEKFCQVGIDFDEYLAKNGAKRILPVEKSDNDFDDRFPTWIEQVKNSLG